MDKTLKDKLAIIKQAAKEAELKNYTGVARPLGGGEINDTYALDCGDREIILRISRYEDMNTLKQEAHALNMLDIPGVPKLIYYDETNKILGRSWILESMVNGNKTNRLTPHQFRNLGRLLARVHATKVNMPAGIHIWERFLDETKLFGDEGFLLNHPDVQLRRLIKRGHAYFKELQPKYDKVALSLIHGDATPSNTLVTGNEVGLIDWEFSKFKDPMAEFSTIFYEDIEYNLGKWRIRISDEEKQALYEGYRAAGGVIDEERLRFWILFDKLGAATFLYWRIHHSSRPASDEAAAQYHTDYAALVESLERTVPT